MSDQRPTSHERDNEELKPDNPPRHSTEPEGSEASTKTRKTKSDPATGKPNG